MIFSQISLYLFSLLSTDSFLLFKTRNPISMIFLKFTKYLSNLLGNWEMRTINYNYWVKINGSDFVINYKIFFDI